MTTEFTPPEHTSEPVAHPLHIPKHRVCNGARLGRKRVEVEQLLLQGESKLKIARMLKISAHSVRAVARDLDTPGYAALSDGVATAPAMTLSPPQSIPDALRAKAMRSVEGITEEKLKKASPQACAIVADRLLGRAETIEGRMGNPHEFAQLFAEFGIVPSHSASRLTVEQRITVESQSATPQAAK